MCPDLPFLYSALRTQMLILSERSVHKIAVKQKAETGWRSRLWQLRCDQDKLFSQVHMRCLNQGLKW